VEPPADFSFAGLDHLQRSIEDIDDAIERNDTDTKKIKNALFRFWKDNDTTDEFAFDALKDGDAPAALDAWNRRMTTKDKTGERFRDVT
jgi:hypothetical protein